MPRYPKAVVRVNLDGPDGNIFHIIGITVNGLEEAGADDNETQAFIGQIVSQGSYEEALDIVGQWVTFIKEG